MSNIDPDQVDIDWYESEDNEQVLIAIDGESVKLTVAFSPETSRRELTEALAVRDRELDHYFEALARVRPNQLHSPTRQRD